MPRVTHVITGLTVGGAETVLLRLLEQTDRVSFPSDVVCLAQDGRIGDDLRALGVPVTALDGSFPRDAASAVLRTAQHLRRVRPAVVQTWMYHADLIGGIAARAAGVTAIAWGLHNGTHPPHGAKRPLMKAGLRTAAALSHRLPEAIVCCSQTSYDVHAALGYDRGRLTIIPNGFAPSEPAAGAREAVRAEFGLPPNSQVILRPGRYHPQKDYSTLMAAASELVDECPDAFWVLCGTGVDTGNAALVRLLPQGAARERVRLVGPRDDMHRLYSAADVVVSSSSYGEALPLVLGEAMAVGVPAVATAVGDAARIVDGAGFVVPPEDPAALARGVRAVLTAAPAERDRLKSLARSHITENFGLSSMVREYEALYRRLSGEPVGPAGEPSTP